MQRSWIWIVLAMVASTGLAVPEAAAQEPASPGAPPVSAATAALAPSRDAVLRARYQLRVMEGVLENAVQHGIRSVADQMRLVSPDIIFFGSPSRARGFRLEGYGVFFDVDVPTLRPSVTWSMRQLSQLMPEVGGALQSLRRIVQGMGDARTRSEAEQALRLVELRVGPFDVPGGPSGSGVQSATGPVPAVPIDPAAAYEREVKAALIEAILDYGSTVGLRADEWLAVAARSNDAGLGNDGVDAVTVLLRVRGRDLEAFRAGELTREQVSQRVSVTEF